VRASASAKFSASDEVPNQRPVQVGFGVPFGQAEEVEPVGVLERAAHPPTAQAPASATGGYFT
jgi:hypothetical protein